MMADKIAHFADGWVDASDEEIPPEFLTPTPTPPPASQTRPPQQLSIQHVSARRPTAEGGICEANVLKV